MEVDEKEYHIFKLINYGEELFQFIVQNCILDKNYPKTLKELEESISNRFLNDPTDLFIRNICLYKQACGYSTEGGYLVLKKRFYRYASSTIEGEYFELDFIKKDSLYCKSHMGYYQSMDNSTHFISNKYSEAFFRKFKKLIKESYYDTNKW